TPFYFKIAGRSSGTEYYAPQFGAGEGATGHFETTYAVTSDELLFVVFPSGSGDNTLIIDNFKITRIA
ncbi:MAG: hypothetical protein LBM99_01350, partial [Bacillales bacterium]|nr:hypothetical protein [Bacillales bacterium]